MKPWLAPLLLLTLGDPLAAQDFTYRGFSEVRALVYPQTAPRDDDRLSVEGRIRFEPAHRPVQWLTLEGSVEARLDSLGQVERTWRVDWLDRGRKRPALAVRQATATPRRGRFVAGLGKQFIRWGKTDILTPTDRFAPRDFLELANDDFLAVTGARVQYGGGSHAFDVVWVPFFTPSRLPLFERRWAAVPENLGPFVLVDQGAIFPDRSQAGARWSYTGPGFDLSVSYFDGLNHLPEIAAQPLSGLPAVAVTRSYAPLKMAGLDGAWPLRWFTIKGEAARLDTASDNEDDVVLYVVQLERMQGELSLVGGYAGEIVTKRRATFGFAPDRGLTRSFLGRASYTLDANRSVTADGVVRQDLDGVLVTGEYSQATGAHWRLTLAGTVIGGRDGDFLGQYRRNSHLMLSTRFSF